MADYWQADDKYIMRDGVQIGSLVTAELASQAVREHNAQEALIKSLNAALHAMRSYYYGNSSMDLAREVEQSAALALSLASKGE